VTTLLIDADYFFYRAASATEEELDFDVDLSVILGNFTEAKKIVVAEMNKLQERF
jgi:DNA polymerase-1